MYCRRHLKHSLEICTDAGYKVTRDRHPEVYLVSRMYVIVFPQ
jgi:hypothetical protein